MTENPKPDEKMGSDYLNSNSPAGEFDGSRKISVTDDINGLQHSSTKSDSFVVDMERFSHLIEKDINANSRITLQRSLSRKGSSRGGGGDKKFNTNTTATERDVSMVATSPRATLHGGTSTPEKPVVVVPLGATGHPIAGPQVHHQITITNGSLSGTTTETKSGGRRFSFRRSPPSWTIDPRRILFFFATLSCMGTILLIYFTISMGKLNGDDNALN